MLSKYNWMSLVTGVLLIIAAVYMFANPAVPLAALGFVSPSRCCSVAYLKWSATSVC